MNNDILKKGADYILKGGTLLSEPCQECNGLLIKFKGNILCLNCQGNEKKQIQLNNENKRSNEIKEVQIEQKNSNENMMDKIYKFQNFDEYNNILQQIKETIIKKIIDINKSIDSENDIDKQQKNLKVLILYLKTLKKINKYNN
jgi:uncharacterized Zn finger protein (UPF0148 family)